MKTFYRCLLCAVILSLYVAQSAAQSADSLISELNKKSNPETTRLRLLDEISWLLINSDVPKALQYAKQGFDLATKAGDQKNQALFLRNLGVAQYMGDNYDSAHYYLDRALEKVNSVQDDGLTLKIYIAQANLNLQTSVYSTAIEIYLKALKLAEKLKMKKEIGKIKHNMGTAYQRMDNMPQALKYFEQSRVIAIEIDDTHSLAFLNMAISNIYMEDDPPKALSLALESLRLFRQHENTFGEVMSILTVSQCYYLDKKFDKALVYATEGKQLAEASDFPKLLVEALLVLSNINYHQKKYAAAETFAEQALKLDTTTSHLVTNLLENIMKSNIYLGNAEKATAYVDKYRDHINRFSNETYQQSLSEQEVKYESEKKELLIAGLEKEKMAYTLIIILAVLLLVIVSILMINRSKLLKQKIIQVEQEKQLVAIQATLNGETMERTRLARDLHDGLGSMLSVVKHSLPNYNSGAVIDQDDVNQFKNSVNLLDTSITELRRIAHHMMPESLIKLGLKDSLADFCRTNPLVKFQAVGTFDRIDNKLEVLLYRIVHELVTNALKHAEAKEIKVQLLQDANRISVTVQDDGKGFKREQIKDSGMGLSNIQHRVKSFNGLIDIESDEKGTEIHVEFKLL